MRIAALLLLASLAGGCNRTRADADALDADADARARTAAKTIADLAAADQASAAPLPAAATRPVERHVEAAPPPENDDAPIEAAPANAGE